MCGIAGTCWLGAEAPGAREAVDRMVGAIRHRGPDSSGRISAPFAEVGFNRLSIIDLTTGDQPLANEDGSVQCFLNGEIYNYRAIREDLIRRGHRLHTSSDTEVLPHLYEEHGERMFDGLRGMFIVCVVDHRRRIILLARDHFGVKQLYYAQAGETIVFSSEVKGLLASGLVAPEVDRQSFIPYLMEFYAPGPRTLLQGVTKLPPGTVLRLESGGAADERAYYRLPVSLSPSTLGSDEAAEALTDLLGESVGLQLQADVPVGISLSGGLDSSAIAALASSRASEGNDLTAITIGWPDTAPEEVAAARALSERLGIRHEVLEPETGSFEHELPLLAWISDEPVADPATYSQYHVAEAAGSSVRVLLGGTGGDELLGGYGHYVLSRKRAAYALLPPAVQRALFRAATHRWMDAARADAMAEYRRSRWKWHELARMNLGPAEEAALRDAGSSSSFGRMKQIFDTYRLYEPANQQMAADLLTYIPEQLLPMLDRATMAVSVEGRVPFIDVPLIEFCMSLPGDTKLGRPPLAKRLLRQAIADLVPPQVIENKKRGMPSHFPTFLTRHPDVTRHLLLGPESFSRSVLPREWLEARVASVDEMQRSLPVVYPLVVFEVWHRLFVVEKRYDKPEVSLSDLFRLPTATLAGH